MAENNKNTTEIDANVELREKMLKYIGATCPDELLKQFCNITIHVNDFLDLLMDNKSDNTSRVRFITSSMDCVNVICKFVSLVGTGTVGPSEVSDITDQSESQDKHTEEKMDSSNATEENQKINPFAANKPKENTNPFVKLANELNLNDDELNNLTPLDIITNELDNWGISQNSYGYKAMITLASIKPLKEYSPSDLILKIAEKNKKPVSSTHSALQSIVNKADFTKSKYLPVFAHMDRTEITKEMIIEQFYDFIK